MAPKKRPELISLKMCEGLGKHIATEESTRQVLERITEFERLHKSGMGMTSFLMLQLVRLVERSVIFAIDRDTLRDACMSSEGPPNIELPPLPFANIVIEADADEVWHFGPADTDQPDSAVEIFCVQEIERGKEWRAQLFIRDETRDIAFTGPNGEPVHPWIIAPLIITTDSSRLDREAIREMMGPDYELPADADWYFDPMRRFVIEAIHFITAKGISLSLTALSRAQRRDAGRHGYSMPERIYWVTIEDQVVNTTAGSSDRQYHCRWLVRGHWRHLGPDTKTWVRAYIKGPPAAPWRGRPVYQVV